MVNRELLVRKHQHASGGIPNNSSASSVYPGAIQAPGGRNGRFLDIESYATGYGIQAMLRLPARLLQIDRLRVFSFSI
jgi:hypothetical protein